MLARKSFLIFLTNIIAGVLGVGSLFFVGRYFEPGPYGMFWFAMGLLGLVSALTKLGFEKAHVKRISEGRDLATCVGTYTRIKLLIIAGFLVVATAIVVAREVTVGFIAATTFPVVLVVIVYKVILKLRLIPKKTFDALRLTASSEFSNLIENVTRFPLVVIVTLSFAYSRGEMIPLRGVWDAVTGWLGTIPAMTDGTGAVLIGGAYTGGLFVSLLAAVWLMRRHQIPVGGYDADLARSYWTFAWPIASYAILKTMTHHIDMVMLGYFWTGTEVGFYRAAHQFVAIVIIIPAAVRTLFFPMINELISRRQMDTVKDLAVTTQRFMSMVMIPILMLTMVYAEDVFRIVMSLTWTPAAPALRLLVVHATLSVFTTVVSSTLLGIDRVKTVMTISLVSVGLNVSLNAILIPSSILGVPLFGMQMTGAALASVLSKAVAVVLFFYFNKRFMGSFYISMSVPKHLVAAAVAGGFMWAAEHYWRWFDVVRVWELAIASAVTLAIYVGLLVLLREFKRRDLLFFLDLANPGPMGRYIKKELKGKE